MSRLVKLAAMAVVASGLAAAATPWRIARAAATRAFADSLARDPDIRATVAGRVTFKLLPRPRLQATQLSASTPDGAISLDAPLLKAELDIPSLLRGIWRISSATLVEPTLSVDVDRLPARPLAATAPPGPPFKLQLRSGLLRMRSATGIADLLATGVDATVAWSGDGERLAVSGNATVRGTAAQFAGALERPSLCLSPAGSSASLQIASTLFDFSADGVLSGGSQEQFVGRAALATTSLPGLARTLGGLPPTLGARRAAVSGDLVAKAHDLSLSNAQLRLDKSRFEGTLAWRRDGGRGLVAGTLATDLLDVDALAGDSLGAPRVGRLYREPLSASPFGTDIDMRVSVTLARFGRVTLDDAAVAVLVRGNRLELTVDEAGVYGGIVKARAIATLGPDGIDAHADVSSKRVDLGSISEALDGQERVSGLMTAHGSLDGHGGSFRDVVATLKGDGQIRIEDGRLSGLSLAQALRRLGRRMPLDADRHGTPTRFDEALWDVSVRDGVLRIPEGRLTAPGVALTFGAETGLPDGRVDVHAVAAQTDGSGAPIRGGQSMPFDMRGFWTGPLTLVGRGAGSPALALPLVDGLAVGR